MRTKKNFKRIALVALLAVAGLFSVSAAVLNKQVDKGQVTEVEAAASHDDPGDVAWKKEYKNNNWYRVIYFHVHSSWEANVCFGGDDNSWRYVYSLDDTYDSGNVTSIIFGRTDTESINEIMGDFLAKVYLPTNVKHVQFRSYKNYDSNSYSTSVLDLNQNDGANKVGYYVTQDNYSVQGVDTSWNHSDGAWYSETDFLNKFYTIYFASPSGWNGGGNGLTNDYVKCYYTSTPQEKESTTGYFKNAITRPTRIYSNVVFELETGIKCAKFLIPSDADSIWMAIEFDSEGNGNYATHVNLGSTNNMIYYVTTNYRSKTGTYGSDSSVQLITYESFETTTLRSSTVNFCRIYFDKNTWSAENPRINSLNLSDHYGEAMVFVNDSTSSQYADTYFPSGCSHYIDYYLTATSTLYFRFEVGSYHYFPYNNNQEDYSGYIPDDNSSFSPGKIYKITASGTSARKTAWVYNKWIDMTIDEIGYIGYFDNNGGSNNENESYHYLEFNDYNSITSKYEESLFDPPTRDGYTFQGWLPSTSPYVNKASASFGTTQKVVFTAQWISNTQIIVGKDKVRLWVGYNGTIGASGSIFYKGDSDTNLALIKIQLTPQDNPDYHISLERTGTVYNLDESISGSSGCPRRYDYFDIEKYYFTQSWKLKIERYDPSGTYHWTTSKFYTYLSLDKAYKVFYCPDYWEDESDKGCWGIETPNELLATIGLAGMHTCTNDDSGYAGYSTYYSTFVQNSTIESGLADYQIIDFAKGASSYSSDDDINYTVNAYVKYNEIKYRASGSGRSLSLGYLNGLSGQDEKTITIIIIIISSVSLLSITALSVLLAKKRKKEHIN